jgi:hypothetical protein
MGSIERMAMLIMPIYFTCLNPFQINYDRNIPYYFSLTWSMEPKLHKQLRFRLKVSDSCDSDSTILFVL